MSERTYTTATADRGGQSGPLPIREAEIDARIKKITITDDGKLAVALECEVVDDDTLEQVRNLLLAQRGPVTCTFAGIQGELDL